jgi:hypothetical protein
VIQGDALRVALHFGTAGEVLVRGTQRPAKRAGKCIGGVEGLERAVALDRDPLHLIRHTFEIRLEIHLEVAVPGAGLQ